MLEFHSKVEVTDLHFQVKENLFFFSPWLCEDAYLFAIVLHLSIISVSRT